MFFCILIYHLLKMKADLYMKKMVLLLNFCIKNYILGDIR